MREKPVRIAVLGASGRLGRAVMHQVISREDAMICGGVVSYDSVHFGADLGELAGLAHIGREAVIALKDAVADADVVIDASAPKLTAAAARTLAQDGGPPLVTGVTGLGDDEQAAVAAASAHIPLLQASNFSLGVAVMERLVAEAARTLRPDLFDLEIVDTHHKRKTDAPSGTALSLGEAAARARGDVLDKIAQYDRPRRKGNRPVGAIGFSAVRGGGVVGEHEARFLSAFEEITVTHRAFDRFIFARGAVEAALWLIGRAPGLYSLQDMLE